MAVEGHGLGFRELDRFLDTLHEFQVFDLCDSVFQPYDFRVFLTATNRWFALGGYFRLFRSDPERSREFYYEDWRGHTFIMTRYMRFLRTLSNSR